MVKLNHPIVDVAMKQDDCPYVNLPEGKWLITGDFNLETCPRVIGSSWGFDGTPGTPGTPGTRARWCLSLLAQFVW